MTGRGPRFGLHAQAAALFALALLCSRAVWGQISLSTAIDLALQQDPRVKLASDELRRATAVRQEVKDAYLPSAAANGGAGYTYGITLTVPTVFTLDAQSLVYSPSQRHYTAASKWELQAAQVGMASARQQVEEDVAITYLSLGIAQQWADALAAGAQHARALVDVVQQRLNAGLESQLEWKQARLTAAQLHLQLLQQQDEVENLRERLGQMTSLPAAGLFTLPASMAALPTPADAVSIPTADSLDLLRSRDQAEGRRERALADARGPLRPIITFNSQYARVSPINNVTEYYNLRGRYNIFSFGAIVRFPFLDAASRARQRVAQADAAHAVHELATLQFRQADDRRNLRHTLLELQARLEVAQLAAGIASDQLAITRQLSIHGGNGTAIMNPKDIERSAIGEQQRVVELLDATLQVRRMQISFLRQSGTLDDWVEASRRLPDAPFTATPTLPTLVNAPRRTAPKD